MEQEIENENVLPEAPLPPEEIETAVFPPPQEAEERVEVEEPEPAVLQPESRFKPWLRRALFVLAGFVIVLVAGWLLATLILYRPTAQKLRQAEQTTQEANGRIVELENQVTDLTARGVEKQNLLAASETEKQDLQKALEAEQQDLKTANQRIAELESQVAKLEVLEAEKQDLEEALATSQLHVTLLRILADVNAARFALIANEPDSANLYLSPTADRLQALADLLGSEHKQAVTAMEQRLELIVGELKRDQEAARVDLDLLASTLVQLENTFFAVP